VDCLAVARSRAAANKTQKLANASDLPTLSPGPAGTHAAGGQERPPKPKNLRQCESTRLQQQHKQSKKAKEAEARNTLKKGKEQNRRICTGILCVTC
jgi:hypothetical protein